MAPEHHTPIRIIKADTSENGKNSPVKGTNLHSHSKAAAGAEPQVQMREIEAGVYEIEVTCSCGEKIAVRCESLGASS